MFIMKYRFALFIIYFFLITGRCNANIDIVNGVWLVSPMVTGNVVLAEKLLEIENLAKNKEWGMAASLAKMALDDFEICKQYLSNGEPIDMVLKGINIEYRSFAGESEKEIKKAAKQFLNTNLNRAAGKKYYSFKYINQRYRKLCKENPDDYFWACIDIINQDRYDRYQLNYLISWTKDHPKYTEKLLEFINELQNDGICLDSEVYLSLINELDLTYNERCNTLLHWFRLYAHEDEAHIFNAIDKLLLCVANSENKEMLEKTYNCLSDLALRQGPEPSRVYVIAKIVKARQRIGDRIGELKSGNNEEQNENFYASFQTAENILNGTEKTVINWSEIRENLSYLWSAEHKQRYQKETSLKTLIDALDKIDELKTRLNDKNDLLSNIDKYSDLFKIPGVAGQLYWIAEKLFWRGEYDKCFNVLHFFLLRDNKDGFTIGAAHFYLGRMLKQLPNRMFKNISREEALNEALSHMLIVHKYPTCLTYISYSYLMAAEILDEMNCPSQALALCMVDVPSIDYAYIKVRRHENAAQYCLTLGNSEDCFRHLQEAIKYSDRAKAESIKAYCKHMGLSPDICKSSATNFFSLVDKQIIIEKAITEACPIDIDLLLSALTHSWPAFEDIPLYMANNRNLNNNINLNEE
ncbi:hypothetical protein J6X96_05270 [bacterium]|nr:hypothetical protein [bacterium]